LPGVNSLDIWFGDELSLNAIVFKTNKHKFDQLDVSRCYGDRQVSKGESTVDAGCSVVLDAVYECRLSGGRSGGWSGSFISIFIFLFILFFLFRLFFLITIFLLFIVGL